MGLLQNLIANKFAQIYERDLKFRFPLIHTSELTKVIRILSEKNKIIAGIPASINKLLLIDNCRNGKGNKILTSVLNCYKTHKLLHKLRLFDVKTPESSEPLRR